MDLKTITATLALLGSGVPLACGGGAKDGKEVKKAEDGKEAKAADGDAKTDEKAPAEAKAEGSCGGADKKAEAKDASEPGDGWTCFGGTG